MLFPEHLTLSLSPVPAFLTENPAKAYFFGGFLAVWMGYSLQMCILVILFYANKSKAVNSAAVKYKCLDCTKNRSR